MSKLISYSDSYSIVRANSEGVFRARLNHKFLVPGAGFVSCFSDQPILHVEVGAATVAGGRVSLPAEEGRFVLLNDEGQLQVIRGEAFVDLHAQEGVEEIELVTTAEDGVYTIARLPRRVAAPTETDPNRTRSAAAGILLDPNGSDAEAHVQRDLAGNPQLDGEGKPYYELRDETGDQPPVMEWLIKDGAFVFRKAGPEEKRSAIANAALAAL